MSFSEPQRRAIIEATIDPLQGFARGWSRTKMGPFFRTHTIQSLLKTGALRRFWNGNQYLITARAQ